MRMRWIGTLAIVVLALTPGPSEAQPTLGPTLAYKTDLDVGVGLALGVPLANFGDGVGLMADFIQFFPQVLFGGVTYYEFNGNVTYDFTVSSSSVALFALAGINIARTSEDVLLGTDTAYGLNLGGGMRFDVGSFRPAIAARLEVGGGDAVVIFASLPFKLGDPGAG